MTINQDRRELYDKLTDRERAAVDAAFNAAYDSLKIEGITLSGDDRAENLVGAIARYVVDCRPVPAPSRVERLDSVDKGDDMSPSDLQILAAIQVAEARIDNGAPIDGAFRDLQSEFYQILNGEIIYPDVE